MDRALFMCGVVLGLGCGRTAFDAPTDAAPTPSLACHGGWVVGATGSLTGVAPQASGTSPVLLEQHVFMQWMERSGIGSNHVSVRGQFFDWAGAPAGAVLSLAEYELAGGFLVANSWRARLPHDAAAVYWLEANRLNVVRVTAAGVVERLAEFPAVADSWAGVDGVGEAVHVTTWIRTEPPAGLTVHVLQGAAATTVPLGEGELVRSVATEREHVIVWRDADKQTIETRLRDDGVRLTPDVKLPDEVEAAALCPDGSLAYTTEHDVGVAHRTVALHRVGASGAPTMSPVTLSAPATYSWMSVLYCDAERVAAAWVENNGSAGLVSGTRLLYGEVDGKGTVLRAFTLDQTPSTANYSPVFTPDGPRLSVGWVQYEGTPGYATRLMKMSCAMSP